MRDRIWKILRKAGKPLTAREILDSVLGIQTSPSSADRVLSAIIGEDLRFRTDGTSWEGVIVKRWLSANRNRINLIDVEETGDYPDVIRRLRDYLKDPESLRNKVHYRLQEIAGPAGSSPCGIPFTAQRT
jgi:hypothetical protein